MVCCCWKSTPLPRVKDPSDDVGRAGFTVERWLSPTKVAKLRKEALCFTARVHTTEEQAANERNILLALARAPGSCRRYAKPVRVPSLPRYVVCVYARGLDLLQALHGLPAPAVSQCLKLVAGSVVHMHDHGVAHLDIKPENIVLRNRHYASPMLIDFEYAIRVDGVADLQSLPARGTIKYMAPEIRHDNLAGCPCDVYSLAETIAVCTGHRSVVVDDDPLTRITARQLLERL